MGWFSSEFCPASSETLLLLFGLLRSFSWFIRVFLRLCECHARRNEAGRVDNCYYCLFVFLLYQQSPDLKNTRLHNWRDRPSTRRGCSSEKFSHFHLLLLQLFIHVCLQESEPLSPWPFSPALNFRLEWADINDALRKYTSAVEIDRSLAQNAPRGVRSEGWGISFTLMRY